MVRKSILVMQDITMTLHFKQELKYIIKYKISHPDESLKIKTKPVQTGWWRKLLNY